MIKEFYGEKISDPGLNEMIQDIHESSVRLIEIVNDFLDTSRLELGKMEFKKEEFNIYKLIQDTIKEYITSSSQKKLYIRVEDPGTQLPLVFADRNKTKQVLINLVGNSIKFTETGGITIKMVPLGKFVKVFVTDTGRGISPENQLLLFRKFQQAQSSLITRDTTKGTGLGLYISKLIMEGMSGGIRIESSEVNKGTTFSITLPVATKDPVVPINFNNQTPTQPAA
jgi:signal transduction histidine kinase